MEKRVIPISNGASRRSPAQDDSGDVIYIPLSLLVFFGADPG